MNQDEHRERPQEKRPRVWRHDFTAPSGVVFPDANRLPPPAERLLLPPADPASSGERPYDEQEIDGYTIAEAYAALEAFKRHRNHKA